MKHSRMELMFITGANDKSSNIVDRSEIIKRTLNIYCKKKRRKDKLSETEPPSKVILMELDEGGDQRVEINASSTVNSEDSDIFSWFW